MKLYFHPKFQAPVLIDAIFISISKVRKVALLILLMTGRYNVHR